jgi:hypothetical protein
MKKRLLVCGLKLFVLGYAITFAQKLADWRIAYVTDYTDRALVKLSHWYSGLSTRFMRLECEFNKIKNEIGG